MTRKPGEWSFSLGKLEPAVHATLEKLEQEQFTRRLWERDASLWKSEPEHQRIIRNALGWLTIAEEMLEQVDALKEFTEEVRAAGFKHAGLFGMGGSSLCPDVCRATFGAAPGFLELKVLDSTVPASVARAERSVDLERTLFVVSSKSGGTVETLSAYKYFHDRLVGLKGQRAGGNFIAITDPGTSLEKLAAEKEFRRVFPGKPDIGGRFSALSNFGMVPAALMGVDVGTLLFRAKGFAEDFAAHMPARGNASVMLGVAIGEAARAGRDKLTFVLSPGIHTLGDWIEQLVAESTGKEGKGILPVVGARLGEPAAYGDDRIFVYLKLVSEGGERIERRLQALQDAGHPLVKIELRDKLDLGPEFFRWEIATATAGAILGINPFDQPNVQESKDNTNRLLAKYQSEGRLAEDEPVAESDGLRLYCDPATRGALAGIAEASLADSLAASLAQARRGDYIALLAYIDASSENDALLHLLRVRLGDALRLATTAGYGPRYLHSTGQLHKGGPNTGLFIEITADDAEDLPVPGEPYSFAVLNQAQALGDFQSLVSKGRRVVRVHLEKGVPAGLNRLVQAVEEALGRMRAAGAGPRAGS